jgi:hypothetical protein
MRRSSLSCFCLALSLCAGVAAAQTPVAYVYVAENSSSPAVTSPITVYAASSTGKLSQIAGSPFKQTSGMMAGTNGSHFITIDQNPSTTHQYLHVYNVASNGVIGGQVSKFDLHNWCATDAGAEFDHSGQFVYVLDTQDCGGAYQSFALSKSGYLTFVGSLEIPGAPFFTLPTFSGNNKFAYNFTPAPGSDAPCPTSTFIGLGRESSGALQRIGFTETDPIPPAGYQVFQEGLVTNDPANHLASLVDFQAGLCGDDAPAITPRLASYTIQTNGDLVSANTLAKMPALAGNLGIGGAGMKLNAAGNILAVAVDTGIQFFHFNGASPITKMTGVIGSSGYITKMAWDGANHLYALNGRSGKLHVYTASCTGVVEAPGSPYLPPNSCTSGGCWPQTLIVRRVP